MKEYKIVFIEKTKKYHIEYYINGELDLPEFYGVKLEEPQVEIRAGYSKHKDSL